MMQIPQVLRENFTHFASSVTATTSEWLGRIVIPTDPSFMNMSDPRVFSALIFVSNFAILEVSYRIAQAVSGCLFNREEKVSRTALTATATIAFGLATFANLALVHKIGLIHLQPIMIPVVSAIIGVCYIVRSNIVNYLEN